MERPNPRDNVKEFVDLISDEIKGRFGPEPDMDSILYHLCERGLIPPSVVRNRLVMSEYHRLVTKYEGKSSQAAKEIAIKYDLSERSVYRIITSSKKRFSSLSNITA